MAGSILAPAEARDPGSVRWSGLVTPSLVPAAAARFEVCLNEPGQWR